ncbi:MAG: enoyl-CoA hydratase/isomerase family protein [Deltaproteobacteria bacterium]|nr:enoyl-CoA hydratase/isomerase family protein [Deltaproteobacteria bacterium]MBW2446535.1 enoyl-CoA hydratase/isomerase family protein [Deltaproteobacteria bacterium]
MGTVRTEIADGILTVTLADVENRNALGAPVLNGLHDALTQANASPDVRVVVVTNEGNTFCAGANLKQQSGAEKGEAAKVGLPELLTQIQRSPTPVVGKIRGHVVGGGNGLVASLDIAIAQDDVKFGFTEVRLGVAPAMISVVCLPKMRHGDAMEVFLRGNRFPATRAAEYGLISRAVPAGELDAAVDEVVADLKLGGPEALGHAKNLVYDVPGMEQSEAFAATQKISAGLFKSEEAAAGMKAFLKREKPPWATGGTE